MVVEEEEGGRGSDRQEVHPTIVRFLTRDCPALLGHFHDSSRSL